MAVGGDYILGQIANLIDPPAMLQWIIIACIVFYALYKVYPEFKSRFTAGTKKEIEDDFADKDLVKRVTDIENEIKKINKKLNDDYICINGIKNKIDRSAKLEETLFTESEIIIRSLLACLDGLNQLGANGKTKEAKKDIETFLTKRAHTLDGI